MKQAFSTLVPVSLVTSLLLPTTAFAQITPDGTTSTTVTPTPTGVQINQGNSAGGNLFHSFGQFSVPNGTEAHFNNANDVVNIFSRVTGGDISNIDGLIRANGGANLFLINPAGIMFGEGARLQLGGSFYGSTADSIIFPDGEFSASDLDSPVTLTINAPLWLNFRDEAGDITVKGDGNGTRTTSDLIDTEDALRVDSDQTFALLGGNINLEGATIKTAGGRVELGSVARNEQVSLTTVDEGFSFDYSAVNNFRDIQLASTTYIDASGEGGGNIKVQGRNITLIDGSQIEASTLGSLAGKNVQIFASESIDIEDELSGIYALSYENATGNAGHISLEAPNIDIINGSLISTTTFGNGNAGDISIKAQDLNISNNSDFLTGIFAFVSTNAIGDGGQIDISTNNLNISNEIPQNSFISVSTLGKGDAGIINISATESINLFSRANIWAIVFESGVGNAGSVNIETSSLEFDDFSQVSVESLGQGNSGTLTINSNSISLLDGSQIIGSIEGEGEGGELIVNAETIEIADIFNVSTQPTGILSNVNQGGEGNGGSIDITAKNIILDGRKAEISTSVFGEGDAGKLSIVATESIIIKNLAGIYSDIANDENRGIGGSLSINTSNLNLNNQGTISVENQGEGDAGILTIDADFLNILDGSKITGNVSGIGNGADIFINTKSIQIDDLVVQTGLSMETGIFADIGFEANGNGGNIIITTEELKLNGFNSKISSSLNSSSSSGNGGVLDINASEFVLIEGTKGTFSSDNTGIFASVLSSEATGNSGSVKINTPLLLLNDGEISVNNQGRGNGGQLIVEGDSIELKNNSQLVAETISGEGANIVLNISEDIVIKDNSFISARALENANGGNLTIDTDFIIAYPNNNGDGNDILASAEQGQGGKIDITAEALFNIEERKAFTNNGTNDIDATSGIDGLDGTVSINTPETNSFRENTELPETVASVEEITASNPCSISDTGEIETNGALVVKGKGGIPPEPTEPFTREVLIDDEQVASKSESQTNQTVSNNQETVNPYSDPSYIPPHIKPVAYKPNGEPIYIARGVIVREDGSFSLTAFPTPGTPGYREYQEQIGCSY